MGFEVIIKEMVEECNQHCDWNIVLNKMRVSLSLSLALCGKFLFGCVTLTFSFQFDEPR